MSAPCPIFGFIVHVPTGVEANAFRRELSRHLEPIGLIAKDSEVGAATIVITREGSQATESDRQLVIAFLEHELAAGNATVSALVDLGY